MKKILVGLIAYIMMVIGFSYTIIYINLFSFGYNIKEYFLFIITRYECLLFILGFIIEIILLIRKDKKR